MNDENILAEDGWVIECKSPFEIRNNDNGSFASNQAAYDILSSLKRKAKKKEKNKILEKDLKNWDVYKSPNGNTFIKFNDNFAIAIGSKNNCIPDMEKKYCHNAKREFEVYTLPCVINNSGSLEVTKIGKVKFKKKK